MSKPFQARVWPLPKWLDWHQLLGSGQWTATEQDDGSLQAHGELDRNATADLAARLRGVGIGGSLLKLVHAPSLVALQLSCPALLLLGLTLLLLSLELHHRHHLLQRLEHDCC